MVALTVLMRLLVPKVLVRMSLTPASSSAAAGDNAGAFFSGNQDDLGGAVEAVDPVRNGRAGHGNFHQMLFRAFRGLADGFRNFHGLADGAADPALLIADDYQGGKAEVLTALDDLGNTVQGNQAFFEFTLGFFLAIHVLYPPLRSSARLHERRLPVRRHVRYRCSRRGQTPRS